MRQIILLIILIVAGVAIWMLNSQQEEYIDPALFPGLTLETLNTVNRIEITESATPTVSIHLAADSLWRVTESYDYLADTTRIRQLLFDLQEAQKIEQKTSLPEHYAALGVADPIAETGGGKLLMLKNPEQSWELIIGKQSKQVSDEQYVRKLDESETWLIDKNLQLPIEPDKWLDTEIIHIEPSEISTMLISHFNDDEPFTVVRDKKAQLTIKDLPEGKVLDNQFKLKRIASVTDYLQFKNVFPRENHEVKLPDTFIKANIMTHIGKSLEIKAYMSEEGNAYFMLESEESTQPGELNFSRWLYEVSKPIYDNLDQSLDEFTKDAP